MSIIEEALRRLQPAPTSKPLASEKPPVVRKESETFPKQKVVRQTASTPEQVHSWSPTPPSPSSTLKSTSPTSQNALIIVTVASLTLTVALVVGGAFWLGHALGDQKPVSFPSPLLETRPSTPNLQTSTPGLQPLNNPAPIVNATVESAIPIYASPIATQITPSPELILTGIVIGAGEPFAMINNEIVSIGESVNGMTVLEIHKSAILVQNNNGESKFIRISR